MPNTFGLTAPAATTTEAIVASASIDKEVAKDGTPVPANPMRGGDVNSEAASAAFSSDCISVTDRLSVP